MGDLNTTEREPAYADFTAGLHDAHLDAGIGPGLTWRPDELKSLPFGLFRIDYVLSSPDLVANRTAVYCTTLSDHCHRGRGFSLGSRGFSARAKTTGACQRKSWSEAAPTVTARYGSAPRAARR